MTDIPSDDARRMMALFTGLEIAHGTHGVPEREGLKWGIKRTARTLREPVTEALWRQHLAGERPLGVVPIAADGACRWACIDVDDYDINFIEMVQRVERAKLPLVPCRSKSGGLHLFLFLSEPIAAASVQAVLREIAASLGLAGSEIFPKQTQLLTDRGDLGNWMVMPYFGDTFDGKLQRQVGIKRTGSVMTIEEFIDAAERMRLDAAKFEQLASRRATAPRGGDPTPFDDGPRCLQHLARDGFPEGTRNNSLFMVGLYLKRKYPGDWKDRIGDANKSYMRPPLIADEVQVVVRSLEKKDYEYTCKAEPMCSHCDVAVCRGRRFGVGEAGSYPVISGLSKLDIPEAPIWFIDIDGVHIEATTEQLQNFVLFQRLCMERANRMFRLIKQGDWVVLLAEAMASLIVIEPPPDAGVDAEFRELLEDFLVNRTRGRRREDILAGRPWEDEEQQRHYFRLADLVIFMRRAGLRDAKRGEVTRRLTRLGGGAYATSIKTAGGSKSLDLWWVPSRVVQPTPELPVPAQRASAI